MAGTEKRLTAHRSDQCHLGDRSGVEHHPAQAPECLGWREQDPQQVQGHDGHQAQPGYDGAAERCPSRLGAYPQVNGYPENQCAGAGDVLW